MKKSTLITTIAMIVVVVVALSTATYAWFTSSTNSKVDMEISTTAQEGWYIIANSAGIGGAAAYSSASNAAIAADGLVFDSTSGVLGTTSGLWAPVGTIETTLSTNTTSAALAASARFFSATQAEGNSDAVTIQNSAAYYQPDVIRVVNNNSGSKTGLLTITVRIKVSEANTDALKIASGRAIGGLRFVIGMTNGAATPVMTYYTTGYNYCTTAQDGAETATLAIAQGMVVADQTHDGKYTTTHQFAPATSNAAWTVPSISEYGVTATTAEAAGWDIAADDDDDYGLSQNDIYLQYTLNLGSMDSGDAKNLVVYYWLDGYALGTSAGGAAIGIVFTVGEAD